MKKVSMMELTNTTSCTEDEICKYELLGCEAVCQALAKISGKWKLKLLYFIGYHETLRYGELKKLATPITHKMLSNQLKELEADELIIRTEYPQVPPKVEYTLSEKGKGLIPMFDVLYDWILAYPISEPKTHEKK